jgi:hypothetical protein
VLRLRHTPVNELFMSRIDFGLSTAPLAVFLGISFLGSAWNVVIIYGTEK